MDLSVLLLCLPVSLLLLSPQNLLTLVSYSSNFYTPLKQRVCSHSGRSRLFLDVFICAVCLFRPSSSVGASPPPSVSPITANSSLSSYDLLFASC